MCFFPQIHQIVASDSIWIFLRSAFAWASWLAGNSEVDETHGEIPTCDGENPYVGWMR